MDLTQEQQASIQAIRMQARQDLIGAKLVAERRAIIEKMRDDIMGVLDEMQVMELKKCLNMPPVMSPAVK